MIYLKRKLLILFYLPVCLSLSGNTYYVSPNGKDSNPGTINSPYFTLNKAWASASAGDFIYMRGGTYKYSNSFTTLSGKSGTSENYINIWAYSDEHPIIDYDGTNFTNHQNMGITLSNCSYVYLKNIRITNIAQINEYDAWPEYGLFLFKNVNNCIFEMVETDHIGGWGVTIGDNCFDNLFLNCDSHHNQDPYSSESYGGADGFECGSTSSSRNTFRSCRSWANSDDGWDLRIADGLFTLENCWSFWNGWRPPTVTSNYAQSENWTDGGNGVGLKLAGGQTGTHSDVRRIVKNCLVFENRVEGISGNPTGSNWSTHEIYNSVVYHTRDGSGYVFEYGPRATLRNNISYANDAGNTQFGNGSVLTEDHNSWNGGIKVTDADFVSVNSTGVDGPRQSDGSLPNLNFLKLAEGSGLIDAGVDVGIPFNSKAPDLGAFEFQSGLPAPSPAYISSVIDNGTPSLLEITFDLNLDNSKIPANSSFTVMVNSQTRTINSVSISGNKVHLNLAKAVVFGDQVTVSYTKPSLNHLQTISGGEVANISPAIVTNNCETNPTAKNPPVVIVKLPDLVYAGFVNTIDATSTYDPHNDPLIVDWTVPSDVPVSTTSNNLKTQFLAPVVENPVDLGFKLKVSNGDTLLANDITIKVLPYKPELTFVRIVKIKASDFSTPDYPENILDGNTLTKWSSTGDKKWLRLTFAEPFKISHIEVAFLHGQQYESYFDIYVSKDTVNWEPILINVASCGFSGEKQVFNFPAENSNTEYSYLKFIGHGNALNKWNYISEFKIFGSAVKNPGSGETDTRKVIIYPNPASSYMNISIIDPKIKPDDLRIRDLFGKTVFEKVLNPNNQNTQITLTQKPGIYIVDLFRGKSALFSQKLIIVK